MSTARSSARALFHHESLPVPVELRPVRTARRLRLRYDPGRDLLTLTGPWRMKQREALAWAAEQRAWVEAQIAARLEDQPFVPGAQVPLDGEDTLLVWTETQPRAARLHEAGGVRQIVCGGPRQSFERRVEAWLRRRALETLSRETAEAAQLAGLTVRGVSVGDAATRWGSCSSAGRIRYSWRLILAPVAARRLVVAHEVAHLAHLDHGPQFKALERRLFGNDVSAARALLRSAGPGLSRFGRRR